MFKSAKRKKSQGFTLAEVLIVVSIIGILLAVAIPNVLSYYRSLKLTELDDSARTIFVAAQNRLTAMKNAGENLYTLSTVEVNEKPDPGVGAGRFLAVTSAQADSLASLVPGGSIESQLHDNHYVVEIDAKTGAVYAVWYWEKEDFDYRTDAYNSVKPDKSDRLENGKMVGYYGGSFIDRPIIGQTPIPSAQVINAEELALNIIVPGDGFTGTKPAIKTTITLSSGGVECVIISDASLKYDPFEDVFTGRVALDTLDDSKYTLANNAGSFESGNMGKSFKEWVETFIGSGDYKIDPGSNIDIEVKVTAVDPTAGEDHVDYLPQYLYWTGVNSLFESVDGGTAKIAYGRHLQNLDKATSGVKDDITAAQVTRVIDFAEVTGVSGVESWYDTYTDHTAGYPVTLNFTPIVNDNIETFDGGEFEIRNLYALDGNSNGSAGLFGKVNNTLKVSDTYLVDARADVTYTYSVAGALVGTVAANGKLDIDGCRVWRTTIDTIPGLGAPFAYISTGGGGHVGGLVGSVGSGASVEINNSFASSVESVSGFGSVGGLVGDIADDTGSVTITNSYAAGYLGNASTAGGLVGGTTGNVTVVDSYAAGIIASGSIVAGIATCDLTSIENSYAAVRYGSDLVNFGAGSVDFYGVAPTATTESNTYYVKQSGVTFSGVGVEKSTKELAEMIGSFGTAGAWSAGPNAAGDSHAYGLIDETKELVGRVYPYPMLKTADALAVVPHYGDWLENGGYATAFYWEKEGVAYHFYFLLSDGATKYVGSDLCTDHHLTSDMGQAVEAWGYGLIGFDAAADDVAALTKDTTANKANIVTALRDQLTPPVGTTSDLKWGKNNEPAEKPGDDMLKDITDLLDDGVFESNVILLKGAEIGAWITQSDFHAIETDAGWLEIDLAFAAAIDVTNGTKPTAATTMGKDGNPYQIRTVRQLDNIPNGTETDPHKGCYEQTHDLYGGTAYTEYDGADHFSGHYDGKSYRVLELSITKELSRQGGMFAVLKPGAKLQNIIMYSPTGTAKITGNSSNSVGGLALSNEGTSDYATIDNCIVAGYTISTTYKNDAVGGLVGVINGGKLKITNSAAVNTLDAGSTNGREGVGGLVGSCRSGTLTITNSYAGGTIKGTANFDDKAGGIVGSSRGNTTYTDVYSYVDMSGLTNTTRVHGIGLGTVTGGTAQYWTGGIPTGKTVTDATNVKGVSLSELAMTTLTTEHTYIPGTSMASGLKDQNDTGINNPYPFTPVVKGPKENTSSTEADMVPVHYGDWPEVGYILYWEKEEVPGAGAASETYNFYTVLPDTYDAAGKRVVVSSVCTDHHLNSAVTYAPGTHVVTDWGYILIGADAPAGAPTDTAPATLGDELTSFLTTKASDLGAARADIEKKMALAGNVHYIDGNTAGSADGVYNKLYAIDTRGGYLQFNPSFAGVSVSDKTDFGAKDGDPYQIRSVRQLDNMGGDSNITTNCFKQTHDVNGTGYDSYKGIGTFSGDYNGGFYRILELKIVNGGLFRSLQNATVENVILYSPTNTATIKNYGGSSVGGIAWETRNNNTSSKITNCIVAGYTIDGEEGSVVSHAGGLVGHHLSGELVIKNCAAVNTLRGNKVGGLVGLSDTYGTSAPVSTLVIVDSYAGGSITKAIFSAGGLVGTSLAGNAEYKGGDVTYEGSVYSYVNMKDITASTIYGIGPGTVATGSTARYWEGGIPSSKTATEVAGVTAVSLSDLTITPTTTQHTYIPVKDDFAEGLTESAEKYPFTPVVKGPNTDTSSKEDDMVLVHYGDWPVPEEAAFYWEKEKIADASGYEYHFYTVSSVGGTVIEEGDLCEKYHSEFTGHEIEAWGYGLYAKDSAKIPELSDTSIPEVTGDADADGARSEWAKRYGEKYGTTISDANIKMYAYTSEDKFVTAASKAQPGKTYEINLGFARAIDVQDTSAGITAPTRMGKSADKPYYIRTVRQLDNIKDAGVASTGTTSFTNSYFKQSHDLYGKGYTYTAPYYFAGEYDGGSYRILDLELTPDGGYRYGLFGVLELGDGATNTVLKNIILFAPSGIEVNVSSHSMGGLALAVGNESSASKADVIIENCAVSGYTIQNGTSSTSNIGGLVGAVNATLTIRNCEAVNTLGSNPSSSNIYGVGGLVGLVRNYANTSVTIEDSYAGGTIKTSKNNVYVGGLVGYVNGTGTPVKYKNVYSYVNMSGVIRADVYGIGPKGSEYTNCYYWDGGVGTKTVLDDTTGAWSKSYKGLTELTTTNLSDDFGKVESGHTFPVKSELEGKAYPFPAVVREVDANGSYGDHVHYGDWPVINASAAYVEVYPDGSTPKYGVYGYLSDQTSTPLINTLSNPATTGSPTYAVDDCYGFLVPDGDPCPGEIAVDGGTLKPVVGADGKIEDICTSGGKTYDFYRYTFTAKTGDTSYYHSVTLNEHEFWFNFDYACEIVKTAPANLNDPAPKPGAAGQGDSTSYNGVVLRTARQLAKMAKATENKGKDNNAAQLRKYDQLMDIDYKEYTGSDLAFGKKDNPQPPAALWRHRNGEDSDGNPIFDKTGSYNGHEFAIKNLYITAKDIEENAGFFGELGTTGNLTGSTTGGEGKVQGIRLIDLTIMDAGNTKNVGALAGSAKNQTIIENCGVYISEEKADKYDEYVIKGKEYVGGLVGMLGSSTTVKNSFAAVPVEGKDNVGGFVGQINGTWGIENCYAGGHTEDGKYKSANVTASEGSAGGFVGKLMNYENKNDKPNKPTDFKFVGILYSTCSVSGKEGKVGLFAGEVSDWTEIPDSDKNNSEEVGTAIKPVLERIIIYSTGIAFDKDGKEIDARPEDYIDSLNVTTKDADTFKTVPYDPALKGKDYPYETKLSAHYGDWPKVVAASGLVYIDVEDGEVRYHLVGLDADGNVVEENTLCTERHEDSFDTHITGSFFATFTTADAPSLASPLPGLTSVSKEDVSKLLKDVLQSLFHNSFTVELYKGADNVEQNVKIGDHYIHYAPRYSNVGMSDGTGNIFGTDAEHAFDIRTVEQLNHIQNSINNTTYLKLSHDLYGGEDKSFTGGSFYGTFDGCGYRILELSMKGGLFKNTNTGAVIKNLILFSPSGKAEISPTDGSDAYAGGLIQNVNAETTIENCIVAGYKLSGRHVGGLVGKISGGSLAITKCAAVNDLTINSTYTDRSSGGLVGNHASGNCTVTYSYAGGSISGSGNIGGLIGGTTASTVQYCYSYVNLTGASGTVNTIGNGADNDKNYYLKGYLPTDTDITIQKQGQEQTDGKLQKCMDDVVDTDSHPVFGEAEKAHTFPVDSSLKAKYRYPAVVKVDGNYVHYGDWWKE